MSDKVYVGSQTEKLEFGKKLPPVSRVNVSVDSGNMYTSGEATERTVEIAIPWGTQAMADHILSGLRSASYSPYTAQKTLLDPAAEIGDGITIGGVYSAIYQTGIKFDRQMVASVSAPISDEVEDEYPYQSKARRTSKRQLAQTRSIITKTAEEIRLEVENEISGLSSSISVQLESITSTVQGQGESISVLQQTASSLSSSIRDINGNVNTIEQTLNGVAFKSSLADGTTTINGGCIKTGKILATYIKLGGYMDLYESLSADAAVAGKLGYAHIENVWGSGGDFDSLGFESSTRNVHLIASGEGGIAFVIGDEDVAILSKGNVEISPDNDRGVIYCTGRALMFHGVTIASSSSDRRLKKDILYDQSSKMTAMFDHLRPVTFRIREVREQDFHAGFIAQDIEEAAAHAGLDGITLAIDDRGYYTLNYGELTAVITAKVQEMDTRLKKLEALLCKT